MEYKRLSTDEPISNDEELLNFAYAKDGRVVLRHAEGIDNVDLCKFIQEKACDVTDQEIMDGACFECENLEYCIYGITYILGVQAAELRERLKMLEDKLISGELEYVTRCKNCEYAQPIVHNGMNLDIYKCTLLKPNTDLFDVDYCRYAKKKDKA